MKKTFSVMISIVCLILTVLSGGGQLSLQAAEPISAAYENMFDSEEESKVPPYILDVQRECILDIQTDAAQKAAGSKLEIYQVGKIDATSLSLSFVLTEAFEGSNADLMADGNSQRKQTIEVLYEYMEKNHIKPFRTAQLDHEGQAQLVIPQGVYLICQREQGETAIQATLVGVPCVDESLSEWQYQMKLQLKARLVPVATGDTQNIAGYAALVAILVVLVAVLLLARKRAAKKQR